MAPSSDAGSVSKQRVVTLHLQNIFLKPAPHKNMGLSFTRHQWIFPTFLFPKNLCSEPHEPCGKMPCEPWRNNCWPIPPSMTPLFSILFTILGRGRERWKHTTGCQPALDVTYQFCITDPKNWMKGPLDQAKVRPSCLVSCTGIFSILLLTIPH